MQRALIIDGHNFLFKSFAVPFKFCSSKGTPLQVVTTFLSLLRRARSIVNPDLVIVVFDSQTAKNNVSLLPEYKANRKDDYSSDIDSPFKHLAMIKKVLDVLKIQWIEHGEFEADDVIASFSKQLAKSGWKVTIASSDSDFFQLLSPTVSVLRMINKKNTTLCDPYWFKTVFGFESTQYVTFKSFVGDRVDNIKGISGIGRKRATLIITGRLKRTLSEGELSLLQVNNAVISLKNDIPLKFSMVKNSILCETLSNRELFEICSF